MNRETILIHIPHSSLLIQDAYRSKFLLTDEDLNDELLKMTDRYVDELFDIPGIQAFCNPVSRLVMDPERFRSDEMEIMAEKGMGAIYTKTSDGRPLRTLMMNEKEKILTDLYDPYHTAFAQMVNEKLSIHGQCMIIDAHSFPSIPLPYENHLKSNDSKRPDICLGYEEYHLNKEFLARTETNLSHNSIFTISHNDPFAGSIVPMKFYHRDNRVQSLMIELNRGIYMDEKTGRKLDSFDTIRALIHDCFEDLFSDLCPNNGLTKL